MAELFGLRCLRLQRGEKVLLVDSMPKDLHGVENIAQQFDLNLYLQEHTVEQGAIRSMYLGAVEVDDRNVVLIGLEPRIVARRSNIDFLIFKRGLRVAHSSRNNTDVIETHVPCRPTQN